MESIILGLRGVPLPRQATEDDTVEALVRVPFPRVYFENKSKLQTLYHIATIRAIDESGFYTPLLDDPIINVTYEDALQGTGWQAGELLSRMTKQLRLQSVRRRQALQKKMCVILLWQLGIMIAILFLFLLGNNSIIASLLMIALSLLSIVSTKYLPGIVDRLFPHECPGDI